MRSGSIVVWEIGDFHAFVGANLLQTLRAVGTTAPVCLSIAAAVLLWRNICGNSMVEAAEKGKLCCSHR